MQRSLEINSLESWKLELGLLPVPLFGIQNQNDQFILLNGKVGNFCLDLGGDSYDEDPRNLAWSSDVGHYVKLLNETVEVYRWDKKPSALERYSKKSVEDNLEKFYDYLQKDQPPRDLSIISFAIKIFRTLRGVLESNFDGQQSLKAFLYLLACISDDVSRNDLNIEKWGLSSETKSIGESINNSDWELIVNKFRDGSGFYHLKPNISLLLRHASGTLLEEAIYETYTFNLNQDLPSKYTVIHHYTPHSIARTLVEESLNAISELPPVLKVFDPICGSGILLKEVLRQLSLKDYKGKLKLQGWDISLPLIEAVNFILSYEKNTLNKNLLVEIELEHRDCLNEINQWENDANIIFINRPFLIMGDMDKQQKDSVKHILDGLIPNNISSLFLWRAVQLVSETSEQSVIACILPASILSSSSSSKIRQAILSQVDIHFVAKLGLFPNTRIDTAILVAKSPKKGESSLYLWADDRLESSSSAFRALRRYNYYGREPFNIVDQNGFSIYENPSLNTNFRYGKTTSYKLNWEPSSYSIYRTFNILRSLDNFSKVKDIFDIKYGAQTGFDSVFLLSKKDFDLLPKKERKFFRPAIISKSIKAGVLSDTWYVFYPYGESIPEIKSEDELKKYVSKYYNDYLLVNKSKLLSMKWTKDNSWWMLKRYTEYQVEKQPKFVSRRFGKVSSFAWDSSGDYVVVDQLVWLPKRKKTLPESIGLAYLALFSCSYLKYFFAYVSRSMKEDWWDLSPTYINNMPLPNLMADNVDSSTLNSLQEIGELIYSGQEFENKVLNQLVLSLYQLPDDSFAFLED